MNNNNTKSDLEIMEFTENKESLEADNTQSKPKRKNHLKEGISFVRDVFLWLVVGLLITNFIVKPVQVYGSSMFPTLLDKEVGISNIIKRKVKGINRFDIVIIRNGDEFLVKRVIGLPGETIEYRMEKLYVNGEFVEEPFLDTEYAKNYDGVFTERIQPVELGDDEYYCLGDNRPFSADSRFYGAFKGKDIVSKEVVVIGS